MKYILLVLIFSFLFSCSTIAAINNEAVHKNEAKVYAGTRNDLSGIACFFGDEPVWGILAFAELPFCIVADTVFLPYAIYLDCQDKPDES